MRLFVRLMIVFLLLGALAGGVGYWKYLGWQSVQAQLSQPQPPAKVAATTATKRTWQISLSSTGSVEAVNGISVTTEVAGMVKRIAFESSQRVSEGDILVELEDSVDQAALDGLLADRDLARTRFQRNANLLPREAISQSEYDETQARYNAAKAAVAEQRARIAKKTIRAPFDGRLGLRQVDQGEYLTPNDPIVTLQSLDPIYVDYTVPEAQLNALSVDQSVEVRVDAYPDRIFEGKVTAIDAGVNVETRSVDVRATLANPEDALRPGMFARVSTVERQAQEVLTVPRTAISFNTYGDFVFAIQESDEGDGLTVTRKQVTTGRTRNGRVAVTDGLAPGDRVVEAGLVKLRNGQSVTIDNDVELDHEAEADTP
jgi:membrane fusion protein (multidrug efflux system)